MNSGNLVWIVQAKHLATQYRELGVYQLVNIPHLVKNPDYNKILLNIGIMTPN